MIHEMRKLFGPIRRCMQLGQSPSYVCAVDTPGFTKEMLKTEITHNGLFMINGDTSIIEGTVQIRRCRVHEAIHLPPRVRIETVSYETTNGITIVRCNAVPRPASVAKFTPIASSV